MSDMKRESVMVQRQVEHCEIDEFGVVHFSRYATMFETAALLELERRGQGLAVLKKAGLELRVRKLQILYREATRYGDLLRVEAAVDRPGIAHLQIAAKVSKDTYQGDPVLLAEGVLEFAFVDIATGKPVAVPQHLAQTR